MGFVEDSFTDTTETLLTAHTGEVGATWTNVTGLTDHLRITDANRCRSSAGSNAVAYTSGVPASAEYDVAGVVHQWSTAYIECGVAGRVSTTAFTCYLARYNANAAGVEWSLQKVVAGSFTNIATYGAAIGNGSSQTLLLRIRDDIKVVYVGGVARISSTDTAVTAAGRAGVYGYGTSSAGTTIGAHLDDLVATDAGAEIRHDAATRSHANDTTSHTAASAFSWTHTPAGTPKGVVVTVTQPIGSGDEVSGVTYGGVTMARVRSDVRTTTEASRTYIYFLGSNIPTGNQTVEVTSTGTAAKQAHCFTSTAAGDTAVDASNGADLGIIADPSLTVTHTGTLSGWAGYAIVNHGGTSPVSTGLQAGEIYRYGHDPGAAVAMVVSRHSGLDATSSTYGYTTLASDDKVVSAVVVKLSAMPNVTMAPLIPTSR